MPISFATPWNESGQNTDVNSSLGSVSKKAQTNMIELRGSDGETFRDDTEKNHPCILVLPRLPKETTGTGQRSLILLEALGRLGPVHVVVFDARRSGAVPAIRGAASATAIDCERIAPRSPLRRRLLSVHRLSKPTAAYAVDPTVKNALHGLLNATGSRAVVFRYAQTFCVSGLDRDGPGKVPIFVDVDDRDDQKYRSRLIDLFGASLAQSFPIRRRLAALEDYLKDRLSRASFVWFAAEEDRWAIPGTGLGVLANVPFNESSGESLPPSSAGQVILFVGIFDHAPNRDGVIWFLENCWPEILRRCPGSVFRIVGRGHWSSFNGRFSGLRNVEFVGPVEDLASEYNAARICISPVRQGGGSKIKVVEAGLYGRPVVATAHSQRGFAPAFADALLGGDTPAEFIEACCSLLQDDLLADEAGRTLCDRQLRHHSREAVENQIAEEVKRYMVGAVACYRS